MRIGCSGWVYQDWNLSFYRKGEKDRLRYYSSVFNSVEVNSTFYSKLPKSVIDKWIRAMHGKDFSFTLKVPGTVTHDNLTGNTSLACTEMLDFQKTHLDPLYWEGLLGAVLLQLPPSFRMENMDSLLELLSSFDHERLTCFVEPRHRELYSNGAFTKTLSREGVGVVLVDSPETELPQQLAQGSGKHYLRFHGRNREEWFRKGSGKLGKYDYLYSRGELASFARSISPLAQQGDEIFIYFNNHPSGKAPANAAQLMEMFGMRNTAPRQNKLF